MEQMGLPTLYVSMVRILLANVSAVVYLNGTHTPPFPIQRGVRQGCPLAPYLFLRVAEALSTATRHAMTEGLIRGIHLPDDVTQQNTSLWWTSHFLASNFGFSLARARQLACHGLLCLRDLWRDNAMTLRPWHDLQQRFALKDEERQHIDLIQSKVLAAWFTLARQTQTVPQLGEWLEIFSVSEGAPLIVFQAAHDVSPSLMETAHDTLIPPEHAIFMVGPQS
ncbi:hypothetical protein AXG93_3137s1030 [Marchantia polymorpha subsp. ruderalis]|uniref:Uncharacterized protein n=1 Tax=Marchantia polymorpha subsp. ruderalis TaxID=1480154 RepID=A0A176W4T3_MARPO|nr:hypothetical protein AXG93_3137s1030 [Marchantia polymorpha subsp. ruderalis]